MSIMHSSVHSYTHMYTYIYIHIYSEVYIPPTSSAWGDKITLYIPGYVHCLYMFAKTARAGQFSLPGTQSFL